MKVFGTAPSKYTLIISFDAFKTTISTYYFNHLTSLSEFLFNFKLARRAISSGNLNSSSIIGGNFQKYSMRWYACHNVWFKILDNSQPLTREFCLKHYTAPYLERIVHSQD